MTVDQLIKKLSTYPNDMEVFATDGTYLNEFNIEEYYSEEILDWLTMYDDDMIKDEDVYLLVVLER